jgi:hypothetical protein
MPYTVSWQRSAENKLADIWNNATDRQAVRSAADTIDQRLARSPETEGRPLGDDRVLIVRPLAVIYTVDTARQEVKVLQVWRW